MLEGTATMKMLLTFAATLSMLASASVAMAQSYGGNYQVTVTQSQRYNGKHCLTLVDNDSLSWTHSGPAEIDSQYTGAFQVIANLLMVSIAIPGQNGELSSFELSAVPHNGDVGKGVYQTSYAGPPMDSGTVVFKKNGC
jgi:hypothetical protein